MFTANEEWQRESLQDVSFAIRATFSEGGWGESSVTDSTYKGCEGWAWKSEVPSSNPVFPTHAP